MHAVPNATRTKEAGFTAVELLITLFVGVMFILAANQLYAVTVAESAESRLRIQASTVAYNLISSYATAKPCATVTPITKPVTGTDSLPTTATSTLSVDCPYGATNLSRVTVRITYKPGKSITHAYIK